MSSELLEGCTVELDEGLADNGLHLTCTTLHIHHHGDGHTTCNPLVGRSGGILHDGHVTGLAVGNELGSRGSEGIAVVSVEVRRSSAASLVTEEVVLGAKLADILAFLLHLLEFLCNHRREQLFGLDLRAGC